MTILKFVGIAALLIVIVIIVLLFVLRDVPIPAPTGTYKVGSDTLSFTDPDRECPFSGTERKLFARIFYPTDERATAFEPYLDSALSDAYAEQMGIPRAAFGKEVPSFAGKGCGVSTREEKYPVILFNHGYGAFMKSSMAQFQELASHGYIVVSIGHAYESAYIPFDDGAITLAPEILAQMKALNKNPKELGEGLAASLDAVKEAENIGDYCKAMRGLSEENRAYAMLEKSITLWTEDTRSVVRYLRQKQEDRDSDALYHAMDVDKMGIYGHSMGGIIAGELCMSPFEGLQCGINLDAPQLLFQDAYPSLKVPFGFCNSDAQKIGKTVIRMKGVHDILLNEASVPTFSCTFAESAHYDFCDMTFATAMKVLTPIVGKIESNLMNASVNKTLLLYFDAYLKGGHITALATYHEGQSHTEFVEHVKGGE